MVRRFLLYTGPVAEGSLSEAQVKRFLEHLALERQVAASTQNQAFSAILFFFKCVLGRDLSSLSDTVRAKRGRRLPVVLSRRNRGLAFCTSPIRSFIKAKPSNRSGSCNQF